MGEARNGLETLAARAAQGSTAAATQLRQELETQLVPMVRHALRVGTGTTALAAWILAEVRQAGDLGGGWTAEDPERLIVRVARRLCQAFLGRLRPHPPAAPPAAGSTVCGR